ncbi:MAG: adenosine deaminase [Acidobacteriota bacterium]
MSSIEEFIAKLPKAELHVHLEGTVEPETLLELARRHRSPLAAGGGEQVRELYATRDFGAFLQAFRAVCELLQTPEDYEFITYKALNRLAQQSVRYAEVTLSAGVVLWKGENLLNSFSGMEAGARRAQEDFGIRVKWIFDTVRQFGLESAEAVLREAVRLQDRGVVGLGIGGDEQRGAPELFRSVFDDARKQGLRLTAHAGETAGPVSVWGALDALGAERISHGFTAASDPRLVAHLAARQIPVDICLTSNVRTGCLPELATHPVRHYFNQGLLLSLNTDDPALFETHLNREYRLAHEVFGFNKEELTRLAKASFQAAFLTPEEKESYLTVFRSPEGS